MQDPAGDTALSAWFDALREWDLARDDVPAAPIEIITYGSHPHQRIDVWSASSAGAIVLSLHGGYFMTEYDKTLHTPLARQLAADGYTVCNAEYRRGASARAATLDDVSAAVDAIAERFPLRQVAVVGHSAGGYLSELLARHPSVDLVIPLAPVSNLAEASRAGWDDGGIARWMGAGPDAAPDEYRASDLRERIQGDAKRVVIHGSADTAVGVGQSRSYNRALRDASRDVEFVELPGEGHYGFLDPRESAFGVLRSMLSRWRDVSDGMRK